MGEYSRGMLDRAEAAAAKARVEADAAEERWWNATPGDRRTEWLGMLESGEGRRRTGREASKAYHEWILSD